MSATSPASNRLLGFWQDYAIALGPALRKLPTQLLKMLALSMFELVSVVLLAVFVKVTLEGGATLFGFKLGFFELQAKWNLFYFSLLLTVVFVLKGYFSFLLQRSIALYAEQRRGQLLVELTDRYLSQPLSFHLKQSTVELFNRSYLGATNYAANILGTSLRAINDGIVFVVLLVFLCINSFWAVVLLTALLGGIFALSHGFIRKRYSEAYEDYARLNGRIWSTKLQSLQGIKELKVLGREHYFVERMRADSAPMAARVALMQSFSVLPKLLIEASVVLFLVGYTWVLVQFIDSTQVVSSLGLLAVSAVRLMPAGSSLMHSLNTMRGSRRILSDIADELRIPALPKRNSAEQQTVKPFAQIEFKGVSFGYQNASKPVLENLDLTIKRGDSIGLMGRSGAGKTTIADLLLGLYQPDAGAVLLDGDDIHQNVRSWQRQIAYIPQSVFILDDSVRRNVALGIGDAEIDDQRVKQALEQSQMGEWLAAQAYGLDTALGERGTRLSGGQRQRIAIARALYDNREVLVLDEATSALDAETERAVVEAMGALRGKKTLIVIAHKASILKNLDRIYFVERGELKVGVPRYHEEADDGGEA
jgi:ABC-type bacteriocin/lantibiotic exporter with double-glycine peptidase domain